MTTPAGAAPPARSSGGNVLTRKIGPLPTYGWVAIVGAGILVWAYFAHRNASSSSSQSSNTANSSTVPDFINQTYTTVTPPPAPAPSAEDEDTDVAGRNPNGRSPKVKHQFHQINKEHEASTDKKKTAPGARKPTGQSGGPARHVPAHPARKR